MSMISEVQCVRDFLLGHGCSFLDKYPCFGWRYINKCGCVVAVNFILHNDHIMVYGVDFVTPVIVYYYDQSLFDKLVEYILLSEPVYDY